jgi:hypothetical protein
LTAGFGKRFVHGNTQPESRGPAVQLSHNASDLSIKLDKGDTMKRILFALVAATALLAWVPPAGATPSTQIWIPSTDIQGFGVFHLGWDSYIKTAALANGAFEPTVTNGGITVGVLPFKQVGLEVGIDYRDISNNHIYPIYFNAKLGVPEDAFFKYMPAIAIGAFDMGTNSSGKSATTPLTNYNISYGLIAKNIWVLGRISAGYYLGNANALGVAEKDAQGLLLSWDRTITELSDKLWLAVDYQGGYNSYGAISVGLSYAVTPDASFIVGYDVWSDVDAKGSVSGTPVRPTATVQVDINLPAIQDWFKKPEKK